MLGRTIDGCFSVILRLVTDLHQAEKILSR
jgi:hypothetical protein